jgi:hypothetical protein
MQTRLRLPGDVLVSSLTTIELLDKYWEVIKTSDPDKDALQKLAEEIISASQT